MMCPDHPDIVSAMETGYGRHHEDVQPVFICSNCGETIFEGDTYLDVFGEQFCEDCLDEMIKTAEAVE